MNRHIRPYFALIAFGLLCTASADQPLRVVGTGGRMATGSYTTSATATSFWQRTAHKLGGPVAELDIGFMNWAFGDSGEVANTSPIAIHHAWVERVSTGQVVPLTFSGQRELVMPAGDTNAFWIADAIPSSVWTNSAPARDELFWVHAKGNIGVGGKIYQGTPSTFSGSKFVVYDPANDPGSADFAGTVPAITGANARQTALPMLFLGRFTGPGHLAVIGIGDSILFGLGDTSNPTPVITGFGFLDRAALDVNGSNTIATMNLARSGEAAGDWLSSHVRQSKILAFANVAVEEFGTNDIGADGGSANVTLISNRLESVWAALRTAGVQRIVRTRLLPRTASATTNWISLADQTPNPGWSAGGARDQINAMIGASLTNGKLDAIAETLSAVRDPSDDHYWLSNGANDYMTADGTHPRPAAYALLAPPLRNTLLSLAVDVPAPATYAAWSADIAWNGADSSPDGDPNTDGVNNLLAYALDLDPLSTATSDALPYATLDSTPGGIPWLNYYHRENTQAADLTYFVQVSEDLQSWTNLVVDGVSIVEETADADPDADGSATLRRMRLNLETRTPAGFLRLHVRQ